MVPRIVVPSRTVTSAPGCAVPESVTLDTRLQEFSAGELITGAGGGAGVSCVAPTLTVLAAENVDTLRARSVARAV